MEYIAKYNLGQDVPYTPYSNNDVTQNVIAAKGRGEVRPVWELFYNHYVVLKGLKAPYVTAAAQKVRPEGGAATTAPTAVGMTNWATAP